MYKLVSFSLVLALCLVGSSLADDVSGDTNYLLQKRLKDLGALNLQNAAMNNDELFNKLFPYETMLSNSKQWRRNNMILQASPGKSVDLDNQVESSTNNNKVKDLADLDSVVREIEANAEKPVVSPSTEKKNQPERPSLSTSSIDLNKAKSIAFNSREVRLMGPDNTEVEMKDDLATKVAVVFDNLRQETSQFLGEVNDKLDKGWTDFKQSVDKLVEQGKKQVSQL